MEKYYKSQVGLFLFIIFFGIYARYTNLDEHFAHVDDIGVAYLIEEQKKYSVPQNFEFTYNYLTNTLLKNGPDTLENLVLKTLNNLGILRPIYHFFYQFSPYFITPKLWTYAPLQYMLTPLLISEEQDYRNLLFWGRFPSFIFGLMSIMLLPFFFKEGHNEKNLFFAKAILSLTLMSFSWESIIHAQQMSGYSIGVFSAVLLMLLLKNVLKENSITAKKFFVLSFILGLLSSAQYQILFFIPAFFISISTHFFFNKKENIKSLLKKLFVSMMGFLIVFTPLYIFFLREVSSKDFTSSWNSGAGSYVFQLDPAQSFLNHLIYFFQFFIKNSYLILESNLLFVPENTFWITPVFVFLFILLWIGLFSHFQIGDSKKNSLGLFHIMSMLTWLVLVCMGKITFGPTRHSLILLPLMVILIIEGFITCMVLLNHFFKRTKDYALGPVSGLLSSFLFIAFIMNFSEINFQRKDPFDETFLSALFTKFQVESVIQHPNTVNLSIMGNLNKKFPVYATSWKKWSFFKNFYSFNTIAYVDHVAPLNQEVFDGLKVYFVRNQDQHFKWKNFTDYDIVYRKELTSDIEVEFTRHTKNGTNGLFVYILKSKNPLGNEN